MDVEKIKKNKKELQTLIQSITSSVNNEEDSLLAERIKIMIRKDSDLLNEFKALIIERISSTDPKEILKALDLLDECMFNCGSVLQKEIAKFNFLNEILKFVLPNHKGPQTPDEVKNKILQLLNTWRWQYPQEVKINEAVEMLQKNGIKYDPPSKQIASPNIAMTTDIFNQIPSELLSSTNPKDVAVANALIEKIVHESEKKTKLMLDIKETLRKARDSSTLLKEMLKEFKLLQATDDELETIKELFKNCKHLGLTVAALAEDDSIAPDLIGDIFAANDILREACSDYLKMKDCAKAVHANDNQPIAHTSNADLLADIFKTETIATETVSELIKSETEPASIDLLSSQIDIASSNHTELTLLQPTALKSETNEEEIPNHSNLETLLLNEPIPTIAKIDKKLSFDQDVEQLVAKLKEVTTKKTPQNEQKATFDVNDTIDDFCDFSQVVSHPSTTNNDEVDEMNNEQIVPTTSHLLIDELPLSKLSVDITSISPGLQLEPKTIYNDSKGLKIILQFSADKPRSDVSLIVLSTTNQGSRSISNYQLEASVSKPCKMYLLEASDSTLPGVKPFKLPTENIIQLLLISNKEKIDFSLTCIVSFTVGDDPDPIKECICVKDLPYMENY